MADWPTSIPALTNVSERPAEAFIRTPTEVGPGLSMLRYSAVPTYISGTVYLSASDRTTFDTWYATEISHGADVFTMADPATQQSARFRFSAAPVFILVPRPGGPMSVGDIKLEKVP